MTSDHFKAGITVTLFYRSEISTLVEECENVKTNFETKTYIYNMYLKVRKYVKYIGHIKSCFICT